MAFRFFLEFQFLHKKPGGANTPKRATSHAFSWFEGFSFSSTTGWNSNIKVPEDNTQNLDR